MLQHGNLPRGPQVLHRVHREPGSASSSLKPGQGAALLHLLHLLHLMGSLLSKAVPTAQQPGNKVAAESMA